MNDSGELDDQLQLDLSELFDGQLDEQARERLRERLRSDPAAQQIYLDFAEAHAALAWELEQPAVSDEEKCTNGTSTFLPIRRTAVLAVAIAATILVVAIPLLRTSLNTAMPRPTNAVAAVIADIDALLLSGDQVWSSSELEAGDYQLDRGLMHLAFGGGVMVYIEAPAQFDVVSGQRMVLHHGRLSASVPPEGVGFTVDTPEAEVVDFGTEFSVDVQSGTSEVHVFDGLVRVQPRARNKGQDRRAVDLRTSQAIKVGAASGAPVNIEIASDRFIRGFDEPKRNYALAVKQLFPVAYYRMPIRDKGLVSIPPKYSGALLTGEGHRPPHARGVFAGGALRVGGDSAGRGGRIDSPPLIKSGQFSLVAFVYLEVHTPSAVVASNMDGKRGSFSLSLDENERLQATIRSEAGGTVGDDVTSLESGTTLRGTGTVNSTNKVGFSATARQDAVAAGSILPLNTWRHVVVTADGEQVRLYENGKLVASTHCPPVAVSDSDTVWFGTAPKATQLWNGRIDELALFDRALNEVEVEGLHRTAQDEIAR